jgi:hypothetical protein
MTCFSGLSHTVAVLLTPGPEAQSSATSCLRAKSWGRRKALFRGEIVEKWKHCLKIYFSTPGGQEVTDIRQEMREGVTGTGQEY